MKLNFSYSNVVTELNKIFYNYEKTLKTIVSDSLKIKIRNRKTSYLEAILYKFYYSIPDSTKQSIVSKMNFNNKKETDRRSYDYREKQIPLSTYDSLFENIVNLYKKLEGIDSKTPIKIAVDGTCNNTNIENKKDILETTLNMGYYDLTNGIPIQLNIEGCKNKNNELKHLKTYITNNQSIIPKNSIFILDRFYCSYNFIEFLDKSNYKFIIRFRNNCKNFNFIKDVKNIRILKYSDYFENDVSYDKYCNYIKGKKREGKNIKVNLNLLNNNDNDYVFKNAIVKMKYDYTLVTNLNENEYNDEQIKKLYKERWDIEVFFKLLKYNFKFEHLIEFNKPKDTKETKSNTDYKKLYLVNLIMIYLAKIVEKTYFYNNSVKKEVVKTTNGINTKYTNKPNKSLIIDGIYEILPHLIKGKLDENTYKHLCNTFVKYSLNKTGINKERKAKTPFLKWYVKGHSNRSLLYKFIEAKLTNNTSKLNKNHLVLYKICTITIIK